MALKEILSNPKYGDDMVITIGQGADAETIKVGEIRSLPAAERRAVEAQLVERSNTLGQAELRFNAMFQEALGAGWVATGADGKVKVMPPPAQHQQAPPLTVAQVRTAAAAELGVDENDPLLGPVVKLFKQELASRDAKYAELQTKLD